MKMLTRASAHPAERIMQITDFKHDGLPAAQGGMGEAAAEALRSVHDASGLAAARELYRKLLKLPAAGGTFFHAVLDMEAGVPPAEQLPEAAVEKIFEVRARAALLLSIYWCTSAGGCAHK
jgi:hypothetical protein